MESWSIAKQYLDLKLCLGFTVQKMDFSENQYDEQLSWSDSRLLEWATEIVGVPKEGPADSFVLHAPLELMARAALLPNVAAGKRDQARARIVWLALKYKATGPSVSPPAPVSPPSAEGAVDSLLKAIEASDLDEIDRYATWLGEHAPPDQLKRELGPPLAPALGGAAHGSIALHLLGRTPAIGGLVLRGVAREIGRFPEWRIQWDGLAKGGRPLVDALLDAPELGLPGSDFIFPMVSHGAESARRLLHDVSNDPGAGGRAVSRVAAWSMFQEPSTYTPYGWTHTLTIPQAVMSLKIDPSLAVAVAGTLVVGFRASMGSLRLDPDLPAPAIDPQRVSNLASDASRHFDAHVVKYTLACFDAAAADPEMADLYMAAASQLCSWWSTQPDDGFYDDGSTRRATGRP